MTATPVTIVVATRNRRDALLHTLATLRGCRAPVVVVDNASDDGTPRSVRDEFPSVEVIELPCNIGGAARTVGARAARSPYVAFADDDSSWPQSSLDLAVAILDAQPRLALVAAHVLVGPTATVDPLSETMARSPLGALLSGTGRRVLGFMACGAIVRRQPFLAVGGFSPRFLIGGEEELVALDLRAGGWELAYVPAVVAHHHPAARGEEAHARRRYMLTRNALWTAWLRYPWRLAHDTTWNALVRAGNDGAARLAFKDALHDAPAIARSRRPVPPSVRRELALLHSAHRGAA